MEVAMLAYTPHDVRITSEIRALPPQDGWACYERTGQATLICSCGHSDGPMPSPLAVMLAKLHIHGIA
ncbi:hypothetical protein [Streptomyces dengpaensis]|uniref:Uncharacterized protein n=1 Tax=Streptomyces dengpaensis TaxID=2049881 RepID=A0ABM6ST95_9ACTN|nr:hypothetical protein [Streptomyces dengpaensis]AVH57876.1 hypothetical protein C4B68_21280 [Streptomyces dengpaensis]PIB03943.1 hypothetical protein B1C81_35445 [Streptomyces sp. HG99]